ncbi:c-type cytochrome [Cardiobacterium valvarum]|uniref:c-type cytochrome n=1 Tax=Cardiobacterium valvarum TaxID=194702 RepID=UPI0035E49841
MQPQAALLADEDIVNVAAYFAAQTPPPATTEGAGKIPKNCWRLAKHSIAVVISKKVSPPAWPAMAPPVMVSNRPLSRVSGQHAKYTRTQLDAFKTSALFDQQASETDLSSLVVRGNAPNGMMRDVAEKLTPNKSKPSPATCRDYICRKPLNCTNTMTNGGDNP